VLTKQPDAQAFTNDYVTKAIDVLKGEGVDVEGANFKAEEVTLNAGGA
jgi:NitT/TauT family transport system substrate-binding protein